MNGKMQMNECGHIVETEWLKTTEIRDNIALDTYTVMPNHFHGIVVILNLYAHNVGANSRSPKSFTSDSPVKPPMNPKSLSSLISGFKAAVTAQINRQRNTPGIPVWQRNYYEHIIRNEKELNRIREYIHENSLQWDLDRENPHSKNFNLDYTVYWSKIYER